MLRIDTSVTPVTVDKIFGLVGRDHSVYKVPLCNLQMLRKILFLQLPQPILNLGIRVDQLETVIFLQKQLDWLENSGFVILELVDGSGEQDM